MVEKSRKGREEASGQEAKVRGNTSQVDRNIWPHIDMIRPYTNSVSMKQHMRQCNQNVKALQDHPR